MYYLITFCKKFPLGSFINWYSFYFLEKSDTHSLNDINSTISPSVILSVTNNNEGEVKAEEIQPLGTKRSNKSIITTMTEIPDRGSKKGFKFADYSQQKNTGPDTDTEQTPTGNRFPLELLVFFGMSLILFWIDIQELESVTLILNRKESTRQSKFTTEWLGSCCWFQLASCSLTFRFSCYKSRTFHKPAMLLDTDSSNNRSNIINSSWNWYSTFWPCTQMRPPGSSRIRIVISTTDRWWPRSSSGLLIICTICTLSSIISSLIGCRLWRNRMNEVRSKLNNLQTTFKHFLLSAYFISIWMSVFL